MQNVIKKDFISKLVLTVSAAFGNAPPKLRMKPINHGTYILPPVSI